MNLRHATSNQEALHQFITNDFAKNRDLMVIRKRLDKFQPYSTATPCYDLGQGVMIDAYDFRSPITYSYAGKLTAKRLPQVVDIEKAKQELVRHAHRGATEELPDFGIHSRSCGGEAEYRRVKKRRMWHSFGKVLTAPIWAPFSLAKAINNKFGR